MEKLNIPLIRLVLAAAAGILFLFSPLFSATVFGQTLNVTFIGLITDSSWINTLTEALYSEASMVCWILLIGIIGSIVSILLRQDLLSRVCSFAGFAILIMVLFSVMGTGYGNYSGLLGWGFWVELILMLGITAIFEPQKKPQNVQEPYFGSRISEVNSIRIKEEICPVCHTSNKPGTRYCIHCGTKLNS